MMQLKPRRKFLLCWMTDGVDPEFNDTLIGTVAGDKNHLELVREDRLEGSLMTVIMAGPYGGFKDFARVDPDELLAEVTKAVAQFKELHK